MVPYVMRTGSISQEQKEVFLQIRAVFDALPDRQSAREITCHELCRAFAIHFPVRVVDGSFGLGCNHSWLEFKGDLYDPDNHVIIDLYPFGSSCPFMVHAHFTLPWAKLYMASEEMTHEVEGDIRKFNPQLMRALSRDVARLKKRKLTH